MRKHTYVCYHQRSQTRTRAPNETLPTYFRGHIWRTDASSRADGLGLWLGLVSEKLEWCGYPMVKDTGWQHIPRLCLCYVISFCLTDVGFMICNMILIYIYILNNTLETLWPWLYMFWPRPRPRPHRSLASLTSLLSLMRYYIHTAGNSDAIGYHSTS